ncbi:helix-turn-helix domain-containing protein [Saccharothrix sp. S26]|uniref:helix-turn-helix domain-containing protein n=1 Tax=Saccharothrix sp. S26 TaxID=2907215 RepID=UPI001F2EEE9C|nr:helix-turn-helix domain-containing protein [Saccharothrix sp. S26]MCE7000025.1 helix-turn-helix domain-containing protein [Saccharothrix sp. S26]
MSETARALRAAREAAGVSLAVMAQRTHYSKSFLGMVETGQRTATPELVAAYERALDAQGLGEEVNRRELLAAAAAVLAGANTPEPLARLLDGLTSAEAPGTVGRSEVEAVQHATSVYTTMDLRFGGAVAADVSSGALRWAVTLLDAPMRDDTRIALSAAVGALADRTAWTHFDSGRTYSARRLSTLALRTANAGADPDLRAHVVLNMAAQVGDDHPNDAAALVRSAVSDTRVCGLERANLHAGLAGHLAKTGDKHGAIKHIVKAEALAERGGETPQWLRFLTPESLDSIITQALAAAGEHGEAIRRFENLLPRMGPDRLRGRAGRMIDLADLYARTGRVDEAQALAAEAEAALSDVRSARATASLLTLRQRVTAARRSEH